MQVFAESSGVVLTLSFREFSFRVEAAEAALLRSGVGHGDRIAVLSHPSVQFFVYALGLTSLGAVSVQLNWRQPAAALLSMAALSRSVQLISSALLAEEARGIISQRLVPLLWLEPPAAGGLSSGVALPRLDGATCPRPLPPPHTASVVARRPDLDSLAIIMFTSGSTATPKAVPLTHGELLWNCRQRERCAPPTRQ